MSIALSTVLFENIGCFIGFKAVPPLLMDA